MHIKERRYGMTREQIEQYNIGQTRRAMKEGLNNSWYVSGEPLTDGSWTYGCRNALTGGAIDCINEGAALELCEVLNRCSID